MKLKHILLALSAPLLLTGCFDLDKEPEGVLSTARPFASTGEMQNYIAQFYETGVRTNNIGAGGGGDIAGADVNSDNMVGSAPNTRLSGQLVLGDASKLDAYTRIRNVNFLLNNLDNCSQKGTTGWNQLVGEAYYFRAWYYFTLFKSYGPIAWIDKPLDPDMEQMNLPRDSRTVVADHILADLDEAIALLGEKNNSSSMRVHRDVARWLKSEVALFEGTWEKYHKAEGDAFYDKSVTDAKIQNYLQQAADAAKQVMDRGVWQISTDGGTNDAYRKMFAQSNLGSNTEVMWYKRYDGDQIGNSVNRYLNEGGGGLGITASLVDDYLTIDGRPFVGDEKLAAKKVWGDELQPTLRDPRLAQTVVTPGVVLRNDRGGYVLPPLVGTSAYNYNTTGYSMLKYVQTDWTGSLDAENKGATPAIQCRYADVLLNYAEALAELDGAKNAAAIIAAVQPLRDRVGMPAMDFDREYNQSADYGFRTLDKYIQAVRRERRVETACEGRRLADILRWAAADELIVGQWPQGALFTGSNLEGNDFYAGGLIYDQAEKNNLFLTGQPGDALRYVTISRAGYPNGWQFNVNRDYLLPIQTRMLTITNGLWEQNPGW
ncbi:MAG: RagB/SusD family nutrient uptake outer membrane protein [Bacteroidales bacterium]|nr:RagB/SusD family nutrient uptake outer membrane protein [Bacteroidales bacterium]